MTVCCVEGCKTNSRKKEPGISFHRIPKNSVTRKKWIEKIGRRNWNPGPNSSVCSLHFEESSLIHTSNVTCIKENCFPTIFPPPAMPSTSGISTNGSHDQPSSATDMANTTRCYVPCCTSDFKTNGKSHGISFFEFPKDPNIRKEWVKALGVNNWKAKSNYTICSEHFKEESLYETMHGRKMLYPDALPIKNLDLDAPAALMICRICLTVDTNMQHIGQFSEVFNSVTGLLAADSESCRLPQLLCWECAARLKSAASLRQKALSSDAILHDLLKPDVFIRIRDIKTINRKSYGLKTSLVQILIESEYYDVKIHDTFIDTDHMKTEYDLEEGIPELLENEVKNEVKNNLKEINSVERNTEPDNKALEKELTILGNCMAIEDVSNICQSDSNIKTVMLENFNEKGNTKHLMLQNTDKESNGKFVILQNSGKESDVQYVVVQNGNEENDLKYMILQNDNFKIKTKELITQSNDEVTEEKEMSDEDMLEEYLYSDDDAIEIVGDSDIPKESSKIIHDENLIELDTGVQNVKKPRKNKTVSGVLKIRASKMNNSRAVTGQSKINKVDSSLYESLFEITDLPLEQQREEMFKRQERQSYKDAPFRCTVCFTVFVNKTLFDWHALKHTDTYGKFECTICKIRKKKKHLINRHLRTAHSREYKCVKCNFVTRSCAAARTHVQFHKGRRFHCKQCPLVFNKSSTYLSHLRLYHVNSNVCEYCGYTFISQRGVITHKNFLHKLEKDVECTGPYCKECDVTFLSEDAHSRHLKLSSKHLQNESDPSRIRNDSTQNNKQEPNIIQNPVTCEQCGQELKNERSYVEHFRRLHPGMSRTQDPQIAPYICEQCGKMFISWNGLSSHKWVHTGKKMYQCDHCDKSFTQKPALRSHLATVKGHRRPRYPCSECGKIFTTSSYVYRHKLIHTGLKKFECDICSKKFTTDMGVYQHKRYTHYNIPWPKRVKRKDVKKI